MKDRLAPFLGQVLRYFSDTAALNPTLPQCGPLVFWMSHQALMVPFVFSLLLSRR